MVKKLFKHEFFSYFRIMIPVYIAVMGTALIARLIQIFESDSVIYTLGFGGSMLVYAGAILAALVLTTIISIVRFYKNLFTGEGYLTFTLPVTTTQHINVKIITAAAISLMTLLVVILSGFVVTAGDVLVEIFKAAGYIFKHLSIAANGHMVFYIIELILIYFISLFFGIMVYYACIALGQTFNKNRILMSVVMYFAYYVITQIISTIFSIVFTVIAESGALDGLPRLLLENPQAVIHIPMIATILVSAILTFVCYGIIHKVIHTKLNLE